MTSLSPHFIQKSYNAHLSISFQYHVTFIKEYHVDIRHVTSISHPHLTSHRFHITTFISLHIMSTPYHIITLISLHIMSTTHTAHQCHDTSSISHQDFHGSSYACLANSSFCKYMYWFLQHMDSLNAVICLYDLQITHIHLHTPLTPTCSR